MPEKTLILFAHPALEKSHANRALSHGVADLDGVTVHDLYEAYPDFHIDVAEEKRLMESHDRIVWQHPFYWYSCPALLKEWIDVVLQYGWAYGPEGKALHGKHIASAITTGGGEDAYAEEGYNRYPVREFLRPFERTARLCGMSYGDPLVFYGALNWSDGQEKEAVARYRAWLSSDDT